jgi:hypothetical protein
VSFREKRLADSLERASHLNRAADKIDVVPKQTEQFPAAQPGYGPHPNQDLMCERQLPEGANDLILLWNTWRVDVSMIDAFRFRAGQFDSMRWIGRCDFTVDCLFENPMEQNENVPNKLPGQTQPPQEVVENVLYGRAGNIVQTCAWKTHRRRKVVWLYGLVETDHGAERVGTPVKCQFGKALTVAFRSGRTRELRSA